MEQIMSLAGPSARALPEWGRRIRFEDFFIELVPSAPRILNVKLPQSFASISFGADEGVSSLAGDRPRPFERRPHEFIVAPPNFPLKGESDNAPEVLVVVFPLELWCRDLAAALQVDPATLRPSITLGAPRPFVTEAARRIRRHILGGAPSLPYLRSLSFVMLAEMLRPETGASALSRRSGVDPVVMDSVIRYVEANLDGDLALETLAGLCRCDVHQFVRAFKKTAGVAPYQYVLTRRIEAARALMNDTDESLATIAYRTGFSSQSHMTTVFKRQLGITPGRLRDDRPAAEA